MSGMQISVDADGNHIYSFEGRKLEVVNFESKIARRVNELSLLGVELRNIHFWLQSAKSEMAKEGSASYNFEVIRAFNISAVTTYSKFFSNNRGFSATPNYKKVFDDEKQAFHLEVLELRNQAFAHIEGNDKFDLRCCILKDPQNKRPLSILPHVSFAGAFSHDKLDKFIALVNILESYCQSQYAICGRKVFEEYIVSESPS